MSVCREPGDMSRVPAPVATQVTAARGGPRVTVAIPVYQRLTLLPAALQSVAAQDYPNIELIVSDNGENGALVPRVVRAHYPGAHITRHNSPSVPLVTHLNQLLAAASGKYFVLLCDDDEISRTFVSELVERLEREPRAHVAVARVATMDGHGANRQALPGMWVEQHAAADFIRAWTTRRMRLLSTITHMSRTDTARRCGGYADLPRGLYSDNLLLLKLALRGDVVFGQHCTFTWRVDDTSTGFAASYQEVAAACRGFLDLLDTDSDIAAYAASRSDWHELRQLLREQCGSWYFYRWRDRYSTRLSTMAWLRAAYALPFMRSYYRQVHGTLAEMAKRPVRERMPALVAFKQRVVRALK
jgi:glycosyltransferase involved in cell wall biosynthesis